MQRILRFLYTLEVPRLLGAPLQAGALCWREGNEGLEVLLITGRRSGKWSVPRGWALRGRSLAETARREAWEEAGVTGALEHRLLGMVTAPKDYRLVGRIQWQLALYPLKVELLADHWPEAGQRRRRWFPLAEAGQLVRPKALAPLLSAFAARPAPQLSPAVPHPSSPNPAS
jgi:8-oxo-dGTP pyrophosphatase MutT (NUDIX family)